MVNELDFPFIFLIYSSFTFFFYMAIFSFSQFSCQYGKHSLLLVKFI